MTSDIHHRHHPQLPSDSPQLVIFDDEEESPTTTTITATSNNNNNNNSKNNGNQPELMSTEESQEENEKEDRQHNEQTPLMRQTMSVGEASIASTTSSSSRRRRNRRWCSNKVVLQRRMQMLLFVAPFLAFFIHSFMMSLDWYHKYGRTVQIEDAKEYMIQVDEENNPDIQIWFRTWGNRRYGIPILFVHGGPGNAVEDYHDGNKRFFDPTLCFVVEIDQRGTGNSQPSVRDDWRNMKYYQDISIDVIASDFEIIRKHLRIDQWLVWGGSYGSTIGLNYAERYPESCLGLILRGIYLDTVQELKEVYTLDAFRHNKTQSSMFQLLYNAADDDAADAGEDPLDPNDSHRLLQIYERMITSGNRRAIWNWHVYENNLMEEDPRNLLDPKRIIHSTFPEAQSVAFFETRLWLHGSYENPSELLERVSELWDLPVWICQGLRDKVCPPQNARLLVDSLVESSIQVNAHFIQSGHEDTDPVMEKCLQRSMRHFLRQLN